MPRRCGARRCASARRRRLASGDALAACPHRLDEPSVARFDRLARRIAQSPAQRGQRIAGTNPSISSPSRRSSPLLCGPMRRVSRTRNPGRRSRAPPRRLPRPCGRTPDRRRRSRQVSKPEGRAARFDAAADRVPGVRRLRDAVVLDDDQQRRTPHRREVHALVQQPLAERAVADDAATMRAIASQLAREREPGGDAGHAALHAIAVEVPEGHVLAAAAAAADACLASHDLGDQADEIARIGEKVTVVAVVGQHGVVRMVQRPDDRQRRQLLPETGVRGSRDEAARELIEQQLLGEANQVAEGVQALGIESDARFAMAVPREAWQHARRSLSDAHFVTCGELQGFGHRRWAVEIMGLGRSKAMIGGLFVVCDRK